MHWHAIADRLARTTKPPRADPPVAAREPATAAQPFTPAATQPPSARADDLAVLLRRSSQERASSGAPAPLMRVPIEVENLTQVAADRGKGKVRGSRVPHMDHYYWMPTGAAGAAERHVYSTEGWLNAAVQTPAAVIAAGDLRPAIAAVIRRRELVKEIDGWKCKDTIFKDLVERFVLRTKEPVKWYAPGLETAERVGLDVQGASVTDAAQRQLVMHLLTLRASSHWRANTMKMLNLSTIIITRKQGKTTLPPVSVKPDWDAVVEEVRGAVKSLLSEEAYNAGSTVPPLVGDRSTLDEAILDVMNDNAQLRELTSRGLVEMQEDNTWGISDTRKVGTESVTIDKKTRGDMSAVMRHLRFLAYLEWRGVYELLANGAQ